jgi:hypothetical protein
VSAVQIRPVPHSSKALTRIILQRLKAFLFLRDFDWFFTRLQVGYKGISFDRLIFFENITYQGVKI